MNYIQRLIFPLEISLFITFYLYILHFIYVSKALSRHTSLTALFVIRGLGAEHLQTRDFQKNFKKIKTPNSGPYQYENIVDGTLADLAKNP